MYVYIPQHFETILYLQRTKAAGHFTDNIPTHKHTYQLTTAMESRTVFCETGSWTYIPILTPVEQNREQVCASKIYCKYTLALLFDIHMHNQGWVKHFCVVLTSILNTFFEALDDPPKHLINRSTCACSQISHQNHIQSRPYTGQLFSLVTRQHYCTSVLHMKIACCILQVTWNRQVVYFKWLVECSMQFSCADDHVALSSAPKVASCMVCLTLRK